MLRPVYIKAATAAALVLIATAAWAGIFDFDRVPGMRAGMVFMEGGCFVMGDRFGDGNPDEKPTHEVCVDDFYISKYEVTVAAFKVFVDDTGYITEAEKGQGCITLNDTFWLPDPALSWKNPGFPQKPENPVVCLSHNDAMAYIDWKDKKSRTPYRLLTEAEWEYASRSKGKNYKYPWGNNPEEPYGNIYDKSAHRNIAPIAALGNYHDGYVHTAPVASFAPTILGVHDMSGNVWEWVQDYYDKRYYQSSPRQNPSGPPRGDMRVIRGGSWYSKQSCLRTSRRAMVPPEQSSTIVGFRLGLSAK